jgi:hypothetical protein
MKKRAIVGIFGKFGLTGDFGQKYLGVAGGQKVGFRYENL